MLTRRNRLPLTALRAFEGAANKRSLAAAANELGVTHSAISHQIKLLERVLATELFDRRYKPLRLTAAGEQLRAAVADAFDRLTRATNNLLADGFSGELLISCVPGLGTNWLADILAEFGSAYPQLRIRMVTEFWHHPSVADEADLAIAFGSAEHPAKRVVLLGHPEFFPVCSPRLISGQEPLAQPSDLLKYNLLHEHNDETWSRWLVAAGVDDIGAPRGIFFDGAHLSLQAARAGHGIAMGDVATVSTDLHSGRLLRPFPLTVPGAHPYYIVTPPLDRMKPVAQAVEALILERFGALQDQE